MASRWDELMAEYERLCTQEGQVQCIAGHTGLSVDCVRRVQVYVMSRSLGGEEWDLEAQARNAGVSFEDYAVAMSPLMQMSLERSQARLQEIEAVISREEDPELSDEEVAKVRKWAAIVGAIASLSDADYDAVITIMTAVSAPNKRQHEILQELIRLKSSGKGPSRSAPEPGYH